MSPSRARLGAVTAIALCAIAAGCGSGRATDVEDWDIWGVRLPAPTFDPASQTGEIQVAVVAGGCFWTVEAVFEHLRGVETVTAGYAGGTAETANYATVVAGATAHAESVEIRFDPREISYGTILRVFFSVAHDPTQIDAQFPDIGSEYRSHIYHGNDMQREVARAYIRELEASGILPKPIATRVDPMEAFFPAEEEHQDYAAKNPEDPYVVRFDLPRLDSLRAIFPDLYRER